VGSNHHKVNLAILEAFARQAILSHFLEPVPVLAEIARSLLLGFKFRLQATSVTRITVFNLKKDCLLSFYEILFGWQDMTHRLFLREHLMGKVVGDELANTRSLRPYCDAAASECADGDKISRVTD
jgi:hypothetical protein